METTMSRAFAKAGYTPKEVDKSINSNELVEQKKEIDRLAALLTKHKAPMSLLDFGAMMAYRAMCQRGEAQEARNYLLGILQEIAKKNGLK